MLHSPIMHHVVVTGRLDVIDTSGRRETYGTGTRANFTIRLHRRDLALRIAINPQLAIGEAYKNGDLTLEGGSVYDFLFFMANNLTKSGPSPFMKAREVCGFFFAALHATECSLAFSLQCGAPLRPNSGILRFVP